jgi:Fic family protein
VLTLAREYEGQGPLPLGTSWLLADCMEARGKQELWMRQRPEVVAALRELAIIQSVESSNRIEGVTVAAERLRPLVLGHVKPRDRSEEELAGYRRGLDWIFSRKRRVPITPAVIRHLHKLAQQGAGDAGQLKTRDNEIIEVSPSGSRRVRFKPTPATATASALRKLCLTFERVHESESLPPLLTIATFVFDLLCIHPFRDGNGRVSRLVTLLLLQQDGFEVGRFISLERLIEERKEDYYAALKRLLRGCTRRVSDVPGAGHVGLGADGQVGTGSTDGAGQAGRVHAGGHCGGDAEREPAVDQEGPVKSQEGAGG